MAKPAAGLCLMALAALALAPCRLSAQTAELVRDIDVADASSSEPPSSDPQSFFPWQGRLFFSASQPNSGFEPWVTDGSAGGTRMVADLCPGQCSSQPEFLAGLDGTVFFLALSDPNRVTTPLWRSDGTRAGTFQLTDPTLQIRTLALAAPGSVAVAAGRMFFVGCENACLLWASDGTPAGTGPVPGMGAAQAEPQLPLLAFGGKVYFVAGQQIWSSDGTAAGTAPLASGPQAPSNAALFAAADRLFCVIFMVQGATQLWVVDAGGAGAHQVPVPASAELDTSFTTFGRHGYFVATDAAEVPQLWVTDGSRAGTVQVSAFTKDQAPRFPDPDDFGAAPKVVELGSRTFFVVATAPANLDQLWAAGGAANSPVKLADRLSEFGNLPIALGDRVLYATTGTLWSTDGTAGGSLRLAGSLFDGATLAGGALFFTAFDGTGPELWRSDGTPAGTRPFTDPAAQAENFVIGTVLGGELLFAADGPYGRELWKSNGAPGGTQLVTDIARTEFSANPASLQGFGGQLLFSAFDGSSRQLWQSVGIAAGTSALTSVPPPGSGIEQIGSPQQLGLAGGRAFFWQQNNTTVPYDLWRTDGTAAGTVPLHEFSDLSVQFAPAQTPVPLGSRVFFSVPDGGGGTALWASDGTPAGTAVAVDLPDIAMPLVNLAAAAGRLFFTGTGPAPDFQGRL